MYGESPNSTCEERKVGEMRNAKQTRRNERSVFMGDVKERVNELIFVRAKITKASSEVQARTGLKRMNESEKRKKECDAPLR